MGPGLWGDLALHLLLDPVVANRLRRVHGSAEIFFEDHDPTQGMRQGNDVGTQYRSAIYTTSPEQLATAERVRDEFQTAFNRAGYGRITTEIAPAGDFYYAEDYHQQYLEKNPFGYCPIHATGVTCN